MVADGMRLWYRVLRWGLAPHLGGEDRAQAALSSICSSVFTRRLGVLRQQNDRLTQDQTGAVIGALYMSPVMRESDWILSAVGGAPKVWQRAYAQRLILDMSPKARGFVETPEESRRWAEHPSPYVAFYRQQCPNYAEGEAFVAIAHLTAPPLLRGFGSSLRDCGAPSLGDKAAVLCVARPFVGGFMSEVNETLATDDALFAQNLDYVKSRSAGSIEGIFGPQSQLWKTMREVVLLGGGIRALLLQIAHPAVAAGVHQHSNFQRDPIGRGYRTFSSMYQMAFGDLDSAIKSAKRIHAMHRKVRGLDENQNPYRANEPRLLMWVLATLIDSALQLFEYTIRPLTREERQSGYEEVKLIGMLMGIPLEVLPATRDDFDLYFTQMTEGDNLGVNDTTRLLCNAISRSTFGLDRAITVGLLPEKLRQDLGLEYDKAEHERALRWMRAMFVRMPPALRYVPAWHQAMTRIAPLRQEKVGLATRLITRVARVVPMPLAIKS